MLALDHYFAISPLSVCSGFSFSVCQTNVGSWVLPTDSAAVIVIVVRAAVNGHAWEILVPTIP